MQSNQTKPMTSVDEFNSFLETAGLEKKPHQKTAVDWMLRQEKQGVEGVRGGIIADEMGLGKTIMTLATMSINVMTNTLIVLPVSLIDQWSREIYKTTGIKPVIYRGAVKKMTTIEMLRNANIVIVSYNEIALSTDEFSTKAPSFVHQVLWDRVIYDEAHHLRNKSTGKHFGAHQLQAGIRWMITGTPIQNGPEDFQSLARILGFSEKSYLSFEDRKALTDKVMIRRTKEDVGLEMPNLHVNNITVLWNDPDEKDLVEDIVSLFQGGDGMLGFADGIQDECGTQTFPFDPSVAMSMLRARQACILPAMLTQKVEKYTEEGHITSKHINTVTNALQSSSKMDAVISKILEHSMNGNKKLVFCHFRKEIDEMIYRLERQGLRTGFVDGRTSKEERKALLSQGTMIDILILQVNTCCEGLNLQEFNEVYFVSPHWNPAVEDQAIARCHRLGQKKEVFVYRFYMEGMDEENLVPSLDEYCKLRQLKKREHYVY